MPELPEVQTVVNDLQILTSDTITGFWTNFNKAIKSKKIKTNIIGKEIISIKRLSKNVLIELNNKKFIIIHLKMTGKLLLSINEPKKTEKHLHHIFYLKNNGFLNFYDIRKFATIEEIGTEKLSAIICSKGVNPISNEFTLKKFTDIITSKSQKNLKSILMDQSTISGIGNIYASEIPFDAKLNPLRKASTLKNLEIRKLYKSTLKILSKAIEMRGTSISDYRDANGEKGSFQDELRVYGKAGKKCIKCDTIIEKVTVEQRSTFFCSTCQK